MRKLFLKIILMGINQLTATFEVTFNCFNNSEDNEIFYNDFYASYNSLRYDNNNYWKYWSNNQYSYTYYNGMRCHKATLSF